MHIAFLFVFLYFLLTNHENYVKLTMQLLYGLGVEGMKIFKIIAEKYNKRYATEEIFRKYQAVFTDINGEIYRTPIYNWVRATGLICPVEEYLMIDIRGKGYLLDENKGMHLLTNIVKVNWKVVEEKHILCKPKSYLGINFSEIDLNDITIEDLGRKAVV